MAKKIKKSKFSETFYSIRDQIRSGNINSELDEKIDFYLRNETDNYGYQITLAKELLKKRHRIDFSLDLLKQISNNEEIYDDIVNHAKFELARALSDLKRYQESYDIYIELIPTIYKDYAYVGIGRILFELGYKKESIKAYGSLNDKIIKEKIRLEKVKIETGRLQLADEKYIAAANSFLEHLKRMGDSDEIRRQFLYLHIKHKEKAKAYEDLLRFPLEQIQKDPELLNIAYYLKKNIPYFNLNIDFPDSSLIKQIEHYDVNEVWKMFGEKLFNYHHRSLNNLLDGADLTNLYTYAKAVVDYENPVKVCFIDYYAFDYKSDIANIYGKPTSRVLVGTLPNTKDIISMRVIPRLDNPEKFIRKRNK